MNDAQSPTCRVFRSGETFTGKQGLDYRAGVSAETAGARGICMHLLTMPPGVRAKAHLHENHETAIYIVSGVSHMWYGPRLEHEMTAGAGDILYIPAEMPHLPANLTDADVVAVIARTDPNEQESVVLRPELEPLAPA